MRLSLAVFQYKSTQQSIWKQLTLWQAERHFCHLRFTGAATILSFFRSILLAWILLAKLSVNVQYNMPLHLASALLNINELFDLDDRRKSPNRSGIQMSTNKPSEPGRLVRKQSSCLMSGMYCRCRIVMGLI